MITTFYFKRVLEMPCMGNILEGLVSKNIFKSVKLGLVLGLDSDIMKNYRPVSKVIENVISGRLNEHLINNSMFDPLQSAYRDKHYTETALIKVQNDILSALDAGIGVPQGSVLGPMIYCMYTNPLVISFSGMDCLTIPMQMTHSCI